MGNEFKLNATTYNGLLDTFNANVASINYAKEEISTPDTKNVMALNYVDMLNIILNTVGSYQSMVTTNISGIETVVTELNEMDEDLQNNF